MKDSEFIELLNLYLDHEISAGDAARLEAEVLKNPARRAIYQDYCRMQKACKVLAQDFVEEAAPAPRNVVAFEGARTPRRTGWVIGGAFAAAAAACVAFVAVSNRHETNSVAPQATPSVVHEEKVTIPTNQFASTARSLPHAVKVPAVREEARMIPVTALSLASANAAPLTPPERFVSSADPAAPQFAWMNAVQLAPLQQRPALEDFRFDRAVNSTPTDRTLIKFNGEPPVMNAARWQKR